MQAGSTKVLYYDHLDGKKLDVEKDGYKRETPIRNAGENMRTCKIMEITHISRRSVI